jgi:hypothetical protein
MLIIYCLFISRQVSAFESTFESALNSHALTNPVLDAKEAYGRGNTELVDIELTEGFLLPGIKLEQQRFRTIYEEGTIKNA